MLGYWKEQPPPVRKVISLEELLTRPKMEEAKDKATRRRRDLQGKRVRMQSKRWHAVRGDQAKLQAMLMETVSKSGIGRQVAQACG